MTDKTPVELTAEDITLGMANERTVIIDSANSLYDGKAVRVRTLRGSEFRAITQRVRLAGREDLTGSFAMAFEACKTAILSPGIAGRLADLDHDIIMQIGQEILAASEPKETETEDFSTAPSGSSS
jgi:hypothetical protein